MPESTVAIVLPLPLRMGAVNCYLLQASGGHILIDTGAPTARRQLMDRLHASGCRPGALRLILLTHGDFDHTGNAAYLRGAFGSRIAMHPHDARMPERADMFAGRERSNALLRALAPRLIGFGRSERFTPDILLEDRMRLSEFGLAASVVSIPGHSKGSIGILTDDGHFFCGDLFSNIDRPAVGSLIDDPDAAADSLAKIAALEIVTVHPGHGRSFPAGLMPAGTHAD